MPLTTLTEGERGVVAEIRAGRGLTMRLMEMGFLPGEEIRVERVVGRAVMVSVKGVVVALGRGVARKVFVYRP